MDEDENIILESRNVKFKSILFNAILTNKRIHLIDSKKNVIPSQDIALTSIRNIEKGENAIRDHFLILSLITESGKQHQEVLTFARQSGVERKRECNEWAKKLHSLIHPPAPVISRSEVPNVEKEVVIKHEIPTPAQGTAASTHPVKKKIEIVRPTRTVIEKSSGVPGSGETISPPARSFCSGCGNRVPLKSTFCNYCGTPIEKLSGVGQESPPTVVKVTASAQPLSPQPTAVKVPETVPPLSPQPKTGKVPETVPPLSPQPTAVKVPETVPSLSPQPTTGKVPETVPPLSPQLTTGKVPETMPPLSPQPTTGKVPETVPPLSPQPTTVKVPETVPPLSPQPAGAKVKESVLPPVGSPEEIMSSESPKVIHPPEPLFKDFPPPTRYDTDSVQQVEPASTITHPLSSPAVVWPSSPLPRMIPAPEERKPNYITIGILIMAILPFLVGLVIVANIISGPVISPANTTPQIPNATPILNQSTTQVIVPASGVWVRVSYAGTYIGLIGTPTNQTEVSDTGDHIYPIPTGEKSVSAAIQKIDSTENQIILEVYKNGVLLKNQTSNSPKAIVEIQLDVKT